MVSPLRENIFVITQKQLTLANIFSDCQEIFYSDKPRFFILLEEHIGLGPVIQVSFYNHYYSSVGRNDDWKLMQN